MRKLAERANEKSGEISQSEVRYRGQAVCRMPGAGPKRANEEPAERTNEKTEEIDQSKGPDKEGQ